MINCNKKDKILSSFNLISIISFPTRIGPSSTTLIDNIFINNLLITEYEVSSVSNGLSDHDAQLLSVILSLPCIKQQDMPLRRNINDYNMAILKLYFSDEDWNSVFNNKDLNTSFNHFLNIFLTYIYAPFPLIKSQTTKQNSWIMTGIKISYRNKRLLYAEVKKSTDPLIHIYYKNYCKILK
jgi:hypothetical protein